MIKIKIKFKWLLINFLFMAFSAPPAIAQVNFPLNCQMLDHLEYSRGFGKFKASFPALQSGRYCVVVDAYRKRLWSWEGTPYGPLALITAFDNNVFLDLNGHTINAQIQESLAYAGRGKNHTIEHGTLISRTRSALNIEMNGEVDSATKPYPAGNHILDQLKLFAGDKFGDPKTYIHGAYLNGTSNIIRNSTIKVTNADAGIYLFGPNQIIENNTIIFRGHVPQGMSAPIRLSLGDGSIIRNNILIVESSGKDQPQSAISLIDSKNVVIENNKVIGVDKLYKIWDEVPEQKTSVIENNNTINRLSFRLLWIKVKDMGDRLLMLIIDLCKWPIAILIGVIN